MVGITPRYLSRLLPWVEVNSGTYRINRQKVVLAHYGLTETVRPSLAFYNTHEEIDILVQALHRARRELS